MKIYRHPVADCTVWTNLIVVSTPSLAFSSCFVEAEEPVRVQTLGSELAIQRLDEGIEGWRQPADVRVRTNRVVVATLLFQRQAAWTITFELDE